MFWNPANLLAALGEIPGLADAGRVGTDSLSPFFAQVLPTVVQKAELTDATALMAESPGHQDTRRDRLHRPWPPDWPRLGSPPSSRRSLPV